MAIKDCRRHFSLARWDSIHKPQVIKSSLVSKPRDYDGAEADLKAGRQVTNFLQRPLRGQQMRFTMSKRFETLDYVCHSAGLSPLTAQHALLKV